jgi:hypothetical protein
MPIMVPRAISTTQSTAELIGEALLGVVSTRMAAVMGAIRKLGRIAASRATGATASTRSRT